MLQKNPSSEGGKVLQNLGQTGPYVMRTDIQSHLHRASRHHERSGRVSRQERSGLFKPL